MSLDVLENDYLFFCYKIISYSKHIVLRVQQVLHVILYLVTTYNCWLCVWRTRAHTHTHILPVCVGDGVFWQEGEVGESQEEERGIYMTPCSLANAQRVFWGGDEDLDGRKKRRRKKKSNSRQVRKNDRALKRRKDIFQKLKQCKREKEKWEN